jgi:hypothetical protein
VAHPEIKYTLKIVKGTKEQYAFVILSLSLYLVHFGEESRPDLLSGEVVDPIEVAHGVLERLARRGTTTHGGVPAAEAAAAKADADILDRAQVQVELWRGEDAVQLCSRAPL